MQLLLYYTIYFIREIQNLLQTVRLIETLYTYGYSYYTLYTMWSMTNTMIIIIIIYSLLPNLAVRFEICQSIAKHTRDYMGTCCSSVYIIASGRPPIGGRWTMRKKTTSKRALSSSRLYIILGRLPGNRNNQYSVTDL